jgi:hypothetical protein
MKKNFIIVILALFCALSAVFYLLHQSAPQFSFPLLMGGNIVMAVLTILTHIIVTKQVSARPQAFVRGVYSATFLKLLVCIFGILGYVLINKPNIHKPSLFVLFGIYIIYTTVETLTLSKLAKGTK